jgi:hypothetical protein
MATIHGSHSSLIVDSGRSQDRVQLLAGKPAFRKQGGTRKRAGAVVAYLSSMAQSYFSVPDQTRPRAGSEARGSNYKLRAQYKSWIDELVSARRPRLLPALEALHRFLGETATIKVSGTPEQMSRPFAQVYCAGGSRADLLLLNERLDVLAGAESLFAAMNETNRQDVQGVMQVLKRSLLQELAEREIGAPLMMLAGRLNESALRSADIARAWFWLDDRVRSADDEGLDRVAYLRAGLERLPMARTRVLAAVLATHVPPFARQARKFLDAAVNLAQAGAPAAARDRHLDQAEVRESVRQHVAATLDAQTMEMAGRLERALRPGVRTAEVANRAWQAMRETVNGVGWLYTHEAVSAEDDTDTDSDADAVVDAQVESLFARTLEQLKSDALVALLAKVDTERLLAVYGHRRCWSPSQWDRLAPVVDQACEARHAGLHAHVLDARGGVEAALKQDRRIAVAHALMVLADALAERERFSSHCETSSPMEDDLALDATIDRAAGSLRLAADAGGALGQASLRSLNDGALGSLRVAGEGLASRGLSLDEAALAAEVGRRSAPYDAGLAECLDQVMALLRVGSVSPRRFTHAVVSLILAETARLNARQVLGYGSADQALLHSGALAHTVLSAMYRDGAASTPLTSEARRHVAGLSRALRVIVAADGGRPGGVAAGEGRATAKAAAAISVLETIAWHGKVPDGDNVASYANDPYWNEGRLAEVAASFGLRFDPARRRVEPLFTLKHRARLIASLGMLMAQPARVSFESLALPTAGGAAIAQVEKQFHRALYQRGDISLSVEGEGRDRLPYIDGAGALPQAPEAVNRALTRLAGMVDDGGASLTRLMSLLAQGIGNFTASLRTMAPLGRWLPIPEPRAVRQMHFDVSELPRGEYRVDVCASLETSRPETDAGFAMHLHIDKTGRRVKGLIVPAELWMRPIDDALEGNAGRHAVTTARSARTFPDIHSAGGEALPAEG